MRKALITLVVVATGYILILIGRYWYADTLYARGAAFDTAQIQDKAVPYLKSAISIEPGEALYHSELANSYTAIAVKNKTSPEPAITESDTAVALSPANVNLKRARFGVFIMLSALNPNYLLNARQTLIDAVNFAPTDAKLYYNLGLVYARTGDLPNALATFKKTVELKANYKEARLAYAILLIDNKEPQDAKIQLNYILTNIDPNDSLTKQTLESLK